MKQRQVSVELLRIIAMVMVLVLHANFMALGTPAAEDIVYSPIVEISRIMLQSVCITAVNIFVMISGWFGIKPSVKGLIKFIWQVFYIVGISYIAEYLFFDINLTLKDLFRCFGLFGGGGWFVASYIGLYIISPILNYFVRYSSIRQHGFTTLAFIGFEVLFGDSLSVEFIVMGYSTFSFIGLYLLAAFLRKIEDKFTLRNCLTISVGCIIMNAIIYTIADLYGFIAVRDLFFNYINPLVIIEAASILLLFTKIAPPYYTCRYISALSASCFAVYLLHVGSPKALSLYCGIISQIASSIESCSVALVMITGFIVLVFLISVIVDQPRKIIWDRFINPKIK